MGEAARVAGGFGIGLMGEAARVAGGFGIGLMGEAAMAAGGFGIGLIGEAVAFCETIIAKAAHIERALNFIEFLNIVLLLGIVCKRRLTQIV
jgi:hypothetical protein